ncbi:hypothetical protein AAVH_12643 [Aphelenchoides avenae]|nr:hypothetical protein AAVH_12643 [Aphelenchus avenae]
MSKRGVSPSQAVYEQLGATLFDDDSDDSGASASAFKRKRTAVPHSRDARATQQMPTQGQANGVHRGKSPVRVTMSGRVTTTPTRFGDAGEAQKFYGKEIRQRHTRGPSPATTRGRAQSPSTSRAQPVTARGRSPGVSAVQRGQFPAMSAAPRGRSPGVRQTYNFPRDLSPASTSSASFVPAVVPMARRNPSSASTRNRLLAINGYGPRGRSPAAVSSTGPTVRGSDFENGPNPTISGGFYTLQLARPEFIASSLQKCVDDVFDSLAAIENANHTLSRKAEEAYGTTVSHELDEEIAAFKQKYARYRRIE